MPSGHDAISKKTIQRLHIGRNWRETFFVANQTNICMMLLIQHYCIRLKRSNANRIRETRQILATKENIYTEFETWPRNICEKLYRLYTKRTVLPNMKTALIC